MQMIITTIFSLSEGYAATDKPKAFERDSIYNIDMLYSKKKVFGHLFTFTIKALTYTYMYVLPGLAHFTYSASIV